MVAILVADLSELPRGVQSQHWYRCAGHSAGGAQLVSQRGASRPWPRWTPRQEAGVV